MATMKRLPFFFLALPSRLAAYTLAELCMVLAITAVCLGMAAPSLSQWFWRLRVDSAVQAWTGDLQAARLQALRRGESLQLQRLTHCLNKPLHPGDWRCGWQLVPKTTGVAVPMLSSPQTGELLIQLYPNQNSLDINPLGETIAGGLRMVVQPKSSTSVMRSICINIAGRLRVVNGGTCT